MCASCADYEYSRSCGPLCSDHDYEVAEQWSDDEDTMWRCTRCGSCRVNDDG